MRVAELEIHRLRDHWFEDYQHTVEPYTLQRAEEITNVPAELIRNLAHAYARAHRPQPYWTLGITKHHNATDYVYARINLALLTGHVGRYGSGLCPPKFTASLLRVRDDSGVAAQPDQPLPSDGVGLGDQ
jgi:anaerobic selenocysteine-containing dehydrogenase